MSSEARDASAPTDPDAALARIFREEAGKLTVALTRAIGDFNAAEDLVQDALLAALEHWPRDGIPDRPGAWLYTTARRRASNRWRRNARFEALLPMLLPPASLAQPSEPDDRLRLIFTCCHPALSREAQVALTLRAVVGLTSGEIARAFLATESTIAQRIVRAKRKIAEAGIPFRAPERDELASRLEEVLAVLYLTFNEGYLATEGPCRVRRDIRDDAEWLCSLLVQLLPDEPEPLGLLALVRLHRARDATRFDEAGRMVLLADQDRSRWDHGLIGGASALVEKALRRGRPGPYQLQAAIAACHAEAPSWDATDWPEIVSLYDRLLAFWPSPVVRLNRAIAVRQVVGAAAALAELDPLGKSLAD
jgi:RNA polymerase sigma factor (sigma-70 family)